MTRQKLPILLLILSLLLAACGGPAADESPVPPADTPTTQPDTSPTATGTAAPSIEEAALLPRPLYASAALGYPLWSAEETEIGPLNELIVDSLSGRWLYLVVNRSLVPGQDAGSYPIPLGAVELHAFPTNPQQQAYFLQVPAAELADAPTLDDTALSGEAGQDIDPLTWDAELRAYWQGKLDMPGDERETTPGVPLRLVSSPLTGMRLPLASGNEPVGTLVDFIFSPQGTVQYALLGVEIGLGLESGQIPLPWAALLWNASADRFDLNVDPGLLDLAPVLPGGAQRPDLAQAGWESGINSYWQPVLGQQQTAEVEPLPQDLPIRAAQLMGATLVDEQGKALGLVEDLALDARGQAEYIILNYSGGHIPVPLSATGLNPASGQLVYRGGLDLLNAAPGYRSLDDMPASHSAGWDDRFRQHWSSLMEPQAEAEQEDALPASPLRVSFIFNQPLNDTRGQTVGVVADLVLATPGGHSFVVLDTDLRLVPVPWRYFRWSGDDRQLDYTAQVDQLPRAPAFESIPQLEPALPSWETPILEFWS